MVESRGAPDQGFGRGTKVGVTFGEFLRELEGGNENLYLTTQEVILLWTETDCFSLVQECTMQTGFQQHSLTKQNTQSVMVLLKASVS